MQRPAGKDAGLLSSHLWENSASIPRAVLSPRAGARGARGRFPVAVVCIAMFALAWAASGRAEVELPTASQSEPIIVTAQSATRWTQGAYEVWVLRGNCQIVQAKHSAKSNEAVLWIDRSGTLDRSAMDLGRNKVIAYLEDGVTIDLDSGGGSGGGGSGGGDRGGAPARLTDGTWLGRFHTNATIEVHVAEVSAPPETKPTIYRRAMLRRNPGSSGAVRRVQYTQSQPATAVGAAAGVMATGQSQPPVGARRVRVFPRSDVPVQALWFPDRQTNQWIAVIDSGVNLIVDGLGQFGSIDVSTDRLVIWTAGIKEPDLSGKSLQAEEIPLEIYMEGNIVFRQGERVIYAKRMYYDVRNQTGTVLDAEMLTPVPEYEGLLRLRSEILTQTGKDRFFAQNSYVTSSRMGKPSYRIQAGDITFEDLQRPLINPITGLPEIDPLTNEPVVEHQRMLTGENSFLFLEDMPVFYWPRFATDLTEPTFYIRRFQLKNDNVYGNQVLSSWNAYEIFGIRNRPKGTKWDFSLDWLSKHGLGHGTTFTYQREDFFGVPGPTSGLLDIWAIYDTGFDNLGLDRRHIVNNVDYRNRVFWQHRELLPNDLQLTVEAGWLSDGNFLIEYFEREWDELKDQSTAVELKRTHDNIAWSVTAAYRLNKYFTQTEWLPRVDHFWLGQPLLNDTLTWYEHSNASYARMRTAAPPPADSGELDKFTLLNWEATVSGERLVTRQEIDWPLQLGPVKTVPYALGELGHWGQDMNGDDLQRAFWQAGVRASVPMWRVYPEVENQLWNIHGLAHKVVFDVDAAISEASQDLTLMPLYDQLGDDAIEQFRRRFQFNTYGGVGLEPPQFFSRYYAMRAGLASSVTCPSSEIADDLFAIRTGMRHRWQTKRGMPGKRRTIDWITLDTQFVLFPKPDRDNFGSSLGLYDYDLRWHVGNRLTLVSDGIFDFFSEGQQLVNVGGYLSRPPRGNLYVGFRLLEGPISAQILSMSYSYRMSPKWVSSFGMSVDMGNQGNIGQNLAITRIGESFLISAGFRVDASRGNYGAMLAIEPRFLPKTRLGRVSGAQIPVAGARGLE